MIAIIGGPNSGKSAKAEELALRTGLKPYYLATMKVLDYTGRQRIEKHREMREFMELDGFPLVEEYKFMKAYCAELENEKQREAAAHDLFDD